MENKEKLIEELLKEVRNKCEELNVPFHVAIGEHIELKGTHTYIAKRFIDTLKALDKEAVKYIFALINSAFYDAEE